MKLIGILYHPKKAATVAMAAEVQDWLREQGIDSWVAPNSDHQAATKPLSETDLAVILGGDGSTLRAARLAAPHGVPVFCINMGRVGFLSEAEVDNWRARLGEVLAGRYWVERRIMLRADLQSEGHQMETLVALNDVVVGRGTQVRIVRLRLSVDGDPVTTYTADSLIVATPTGSTAYSMAAGGPLLPPELDNFLVIPVAPHLSLNRAIVLHRHAVISIQVEMDHDATVTADGQAAIPLESGDRVVLQQHDHEALFARVGSSGYFYRRLMRRLGIHRGSEGDMGG
jgi:NAD+ kinase